MKRDKQEGPDIGAFLLASVLHFYSGRSLQNLSGADIRHKAFLLKPPKHECVRMWVNFRAAMTAISEF